MVSSEQFGIVHLQALNNKGDVKYLSCDLDLTPDRSHACMLWMMASQWDRWASGGGHAGGGAGAIGVGAGVAELSSLLSLLLSCMSKPSLDFDEELSREPGVSSSLGLPTPVDGVLSPLFFHSPSRRISRIAESRLTRPL